MIPNIVFLIFISWHSASVWRFGKEEVIENDRMNTVFWNRSVFLIVGVILSIMLLLIFNRNIDDYLKIKNSVIFIIPYFILIALVDFCTSIFMGTGRIKSISIIETIPKIVYLVPVMVMFFLDMKDIKYLLGFIVLLLLFE